MAFTSPWQSAALRRCRVVFTRSRWITSRGRGSRWHWCCRWLRLGRAGASSTWPISSLRKIPTNGIRAKFQRFRSRRLSAVELLLPPTAERGVELHQRGALVQTGTGEVELCREPVCLAGQDLEIAGGSGAVTQVGQARCILCGGREALLMLAKFAVLGV